MANSTSAVVLPEEEAAAPSSARASALPFPLLVGLFVASGAAGLIDQVCFSKYLGYIVGATAYAVSAVLAAFMTGLALGAHFGGRASTRVTRPLVVYGALELGVAAAVALSPAAFHALTPLYVALAHMAPHSLVALSVFRWLVAALLVVIPTIAMGATLPMLARAIAIDGRRIESAGGERGERGERSGSSEKRLGALYTANTFGGAAGALVTAYTILPTLGLSWTLWAAAAVSALVGLVALSRGKDLVADPSDSAVSERGGEGVAQGVVAPTEDVPERAEYALLFALALVSGWLVFAVEVVSTHLLALIIGNSAYAFGLILAAVLCWLFVGASLAPRLHARFGDPLLAWSLVFTGLAVAVTLPIWDSTPLVFATTGKTFTTFATREAMRGVVAFAILMLPVTLMGLTFPLVLQRVARFRRVGQLVGQMTAVNTLGAVAGALVTGYWMLPRLGSQGSLVAIAVVYTLSGVATRVATRTGLTGAMFWIASALGLLIVKAAPSWDLLRLTSGTNVYFDGNDDPEQILFIREDVHGGVTSVTRNVHGVMTLFTNGKFQGNTGWEMKAQRFFAHYPCLFVHDFDSALVIGLGTGTTLGTLAGYPWKTVDVVEISPSIVTAADGFFQGPNRGAIHDPRVTIHLDDGRNYLLVQKGQYDLISMELSSIWFAGAANLYSREYYGLVAQHLKPNGVFQQWVQLHHIYERDFATVLHTLRQQFAHVALFYGGGQGILVASQQPLTTSYAHLAELQARPQISDVIPYARPLPKLVDDLLAIDDGLDRYLAGVAQRVHRDVGDLVSTDDNIYLEYATPKGNVLPWSNRERLVAKLKHFRDEAAVSRLFTDSPPALAIHAETP